MTHLITQVALAVKPVQVKLLLSMSLILLPLIVYAYERIRVKVTVFKAIQQMRGSETIIPQFETAKQLSPAEMGYIVDGHISSLEILATLFELEQKSAMLLQKSGKSFEVQIVAPDPKLPPLLTKYETALLEIIGKLPDTNRSWEAIQRGTQAGTQALQLRAAMEQQLIKKNLLRADLHDAKVAAQWLKITALLSVALVLGFMLPSLIAIYLLDPHNNHQVLSALSWALAVSVAAYLPVFLIVLISRAFYWRAKGILPEASDKLKAEWANVIGFKEYLRVVELPRIEQDFRDQKQSNNKLLAYAVVCNLPTHWQSRFK